MRTRVSTLSPLAVAAAVAGCSAGPSSPPALAYGVPTVTEAAYAVGDTMSVQISALGQTLELDVQSIATFGVTFSNAPQGVRVTMGVEELAAELVAPMAGPVQVDESIVDGELTFSLDRRGRVEVVATPDVGGAGGLFSATSIANTFFPRLPGRAVAAGDTWVDTVSFVDAGERGEGMQSSVLTYTVVGDTTFGGRSLLEITYVGTTASDQVLDLQGTEVHQQTELEVQGRVLWDVQRGIMVESASTSAGTGTVAVATMPGELPTQVEIRSRARLQE